MTVQTQEPRQKRRLLNFVLSNCTWDDGEVIANFRQPFDLLAETTNTAARHEAGNAASSAEKEIWLPFLNTYRTMCLSPDVAFLEVIEQVGALRIAA
jgi:hypothetical protein